MPTSNSQPGAHGGSAGAPAAHAAAWMTDTIPAHREGETLQFIWLAGLERSGWGRPGDGHVFRMSIDGTPWFTFRNYKDSTDRAWSHAEIIEGIRRLS